MRVIKSTVRPWFDLDPEKRSPELRLWQQRELLARAVREGKGRVQRFMQAHGIKAQGKREFVVITDSMQGLPVAPV